MDERLIALVVNKDDGGPAHIAVKLRKKTTLFPGAWLSVASLDSLLIF